MKKKLSALGILVTLTTVSVHLINKLTYYISTLDNLLEHSNTNYYEWVFGKVFYEKLGTGNPLLLIHDLNAGSSAYEWHNVIQTLSKTHTVYAIDLLGCGRSDKPHFTYTNFLYVRLISDFIKHVIKEPTDVIATGQSGSFILHSCSLEEGLIDNIVLVNPENISELSKIPSKRTKTLKFFIEMPIIGTLLYNILHSKKLIRQAFEQDYYKAPYDVEELEVNTYYEAAHRDKLHGKFLFSSIKGRFTNTDLACCHNKINNSIFILASDGAPQYIESARQYQALIPSVEIVPCKDSKKLPQLERPAIFIQNIQLLLSTEEMDY